MLTIYACPKPFIDPHIITIQRNALRSWVLLRPQLEIILFGDEKGTAEVAQEFGVRHEPKVARNKYGTPLVNDLFTSAKKLARFNLLAYVNADIILMSDFMKAVEYVANLKKPFLMVGSRWDIGILNPLTFEVGWEEKLRVYAQKNGELYPPVGIDYFVFPPKLCEEIPPFALGRACWDNWFLFYARRRNALLIDATQVVTAIHQNHSYSHHPQGKEGVWKGEEAKTNLKLAGGWQNIYTLKDATHKMTPKGIKVWLPGLLRLHKRVERLYCWIRGIPLYQELEKMIRRIYY